MSTAAALSPAQRTHLVRLYRRILRASETAFANDANTLSAWRNFAATRFRSADADPAKYEEHVKHAEEVEQTLRTNVVQGVWRAETDTYSLKIRPETELGSNETIKQNRNKQIADLKNSKRPKLTCGGGSASSASSSSNVASASFSTFACLRAAASSSSASEGPSSSSSRPLVRPVPTFPSLTILADGSAILLHTSSPRHTTRLTRDPTNHPLWNPTLADRKAARGEGDEESADEDAGGRLGRFRRRFEVDGATAAGEPSTPASSSAAGQQQAGSKSKSGADSKSTSAPATASPAAGAASSSRRAASFGMDDLDWMSEGGRQARAGSEPAGKKGKGKK
ncbi:hypothetical protein V8E36_006093 [Tilletia maclaganii]